MIVFYEVVIRVARKGQRVKPERVNRGLGKLSQSGPHGRHMREVVPQDVVPDKMPGAPKVRLETIQRRVHVLMAPNGGRNVKPYRCQIENPRRFRIDFEVDGQALRQKRIRLLDGF